MEMVAVEQGRGRHGAAWLEWLESWFVGVAVMAGWSMLLALGGVWVQ